MELARRYLGPPRRGVEIGASAINPFPGVAAWNLDCPGSVLFQTAQEAIAGRAAPIDVLGLGRPLPFRSGSLDFLLASHVLEHMPDTIAALTEWSRVVRDGGNVFLIVPHRARTFDAGRPRTPLQHHLADFAVGMTVEASAMVPTSHYHVWETEDLLALVEHLDGAGMLDWELLAVEDVDSKVGNGFTLVVRKRSQPGAPRPAPTARERPVAFHQLTLALPFQVAGRTVEFSVSGPAQPGAGPMLEGAGPVLRDAGPVLPGAGPVARAGAARDATCGLPLWTCPGGLPGVPRGRYRAVPMHAGFPPVAGEAFALDVGAAVDPPVIHAVGRKGSRLRFTGRELGETTWLEVELPDRQVARLLPDWADGALEVDLAGLVVPEVKVPVTACSPPPGGGRGPVFLLREHLGA